MLTITKLIAYALYKDVRKWYWVGIVFREVIGIVKKKCRQKFLESKISACGVCNQGILQNYSKM